MQRKQMAVIAAFFVVLAFWSLAPVSAKEINVNARSAMLMDMTTGQTLYEQNPDIPIAPASITKVLTLYLVFEAIREGRLHLWDNVKVSSRAAKTGGSRMGLRTGDIVPVGELIKGMAVVSGNDACVAIAEHMSGSVEEFVCEMNRKARELGMHHSTFMTPNGLPAKGQLTTARDIATLSVAYLRRYPESLNIHSMQSYTYRTTTHRNANRLLSTCQGVDGLKTGFVCAAGYNLTATAVRADRRLVAVVLGAPSPGVRATETAKLLNEGYDALGMGTALVRAFDDSSLTRPAPSRASTSTSVRKSTRQRGGSTRTVVAGRPARSMAKGKVTKTSSRKVAAQTIGSDSDRVATKKVKSKLSVASAKGKSTQTAEASNKKSQRATGGGASANVKESNSGKAQVAAKGTGASKAAGNVKPAKVAVGKDAGGAKTSTAKKSTASAKSDKSSAPEKQKGSPSPALRKINPVQKSS